MRFTTALAVFVLTLGMSARADITVEAINYKSPAGENVDLSIKKEVKDTTIYYKDNQMRVDQGDQSMVIRDCVPTPGKCKGGIEYLLIDHKKKEVGILSSFTASVAEEVTQAVTNTSRKASGTVVIEQANPPPRLGQPVKLVNFKFQGLVLPFNPNMFSKQAGGKVPKDAAQYIDNLHIKLDLHGQAHVAPDMKGAEEIAAFYRRMEQRLGSDTLRAAESLGAPYLTRGLTMLMAALSERGFPLLTVQLTEVSVEMSGMTGPGAGMVSSMMQRAFAGNRTPNLADVSEVEEVAYDPIDASVFYNGGYPAGYKQKQIKPPTISK